MRQQSGQGPGGLPHTRSDESAGNGALHDMRAQLAEMHRKKGWS